MTAVYDQDEGRLDTHYEIDLDPEEELEPLRTSSGSQERAGSAQREPVFVDAVVREHTDHPVVPASWRGWSNIKATVRAGLYHLVHASAFHAVRLPRYLLLLGFWALVGAGKLTWRFLRWVGDPDGRPATDEAVRRDSPDAFRHLRESHDRHVRHRLVGLATGFAVAAVAVLLLWWLAPWWVQAAVLVVTVPALAAVGKPAHRHIVTPAVVAPRFRRLNADVVLRAYYAAGLGHPDKPSQQVMFGSPMARDGDGSVVAVDLPYGRGFGDAIKKREEIASGLDVATSQVFITRDPSSNRRHRLWVADRDPLAIPAGRSPLLRCRPADIWAPAPLGLDQRGQKVAIDMVWHSVLVGGQPRRGKTFVARALALHAALDPYVRITVADGKAAPDWRKFGLVADRAIFGTNLTRDGDPVEILVATLRDILDDVRDRYHRLSALPVDRCPEGKLTRELARDPQLNMPVRLLILEEIQEYLETPDQKVNMEVGTLLTSIVKQAPGAGVIVLTSTQKPAGVGAGDVGRLFNGYRDQHQIRFALRCANRHVSDAVLGGDAYSEGHDASAIPVGNEYRGVGILYGAGDDTPTVRTYLADGADAEKILTTARRLREAAGTLSGMAAGDDIARQVRDPLADTIRVWGAFVDRPGLHWEKLAETLAAQLPERYGREDADSVSALLRGLGVPSVVVSVDGHNQRGCRLEAVREAAQRRELGEANNTALVPVTTPRGPVPGVVEGGR